MSKKNASQNDKKLENYFLNISSTEQFENTIADLCGKYDIVRNGYTQNGNGSIPREWINAIRKKFGDLKKVTDLKGEIAALAETYDLPKYPWVPIICEYIFFGTTDFGTDAKLVWIRNRYYWEDLFENKDIFVIEPERPDSRAYPIEILISPYATKRDILSALDEQYTEYVQPIQEKFKKKDVKISEARKRKNRERDDFIYHNRNLPIKELVTLVNENFRKDKNDSLVGYGDVNKIIALEKQRRE